MSAAKRKVILCTYPSIYSDIVLETLLQNSDLQVVGVICSTRMLSARYNALQASIRHIQLSGLRYAAYLFSVTQLYNGLRRLTARKTLHQRLRQLAIPYLNTKDINEASGIDFIKKYQPDVLLSAHFNQLLKPEVLRLPSLGCLNIHPSLLPRFQGVDPVFYALLRHAPETGVTVHLQSETFDSGPILEQTPLKPRWHDSLMSLNAKLFKLGALAAVQQILALSPTTQGQPQLGIGRYDSWPNSEDARQFRRQRLYFRWRDYAAFVRRP